MVLQKICAPALIYLIFSLTQVVIDTVQGIYNVAFIKLWVALIFTIILNFLCSNGLGIVSWIIVFIPFILMTVIVTMILLMFGLNPVTGKKRHINHPRKKRRRKHHTPKYRHTKHDHTKKGELQYSNSRDINPIYGKSKISDAEKSVLNDMVQTRTNLSKDPLQKNN
jgi:predicted membrane protein